MRYLALTFGLVFSLQAGHLGSLIAWGLFSLLGFSAATAVAAPAGPDFDREIAPLLARRCGECHNADEPKGGLDLTSKTRALAGGESGRAIVAGQASASLLWQRIDANEMPPKHPLPAAEKTRLKQWIDAGAAWGADRVDPLRYSSERRAGYDWWSLQPLRVVPPDAAFRAASPIDAYLESARRQKGLAASPPADPAVLARRIHFDLLGLPPDAATLDEFLPRRVPMAAGTAPHSPRASSASPVSEANDPRVHSTGADSADTLAPDAYARLVDRLLAQPSFGERWARHWLDVARFGESDGFEYDRLRPQAWPYRDWVISALNRDLPYDEFARWQIAGDVLRPQDPGAIAATGFLVGGAFDGLVPAGDAMRQIMRQDELEDLVGTVTQTFLGLTVNCGRCHDHKFDPIPQADYFRVAAALGGVRRGERPLPAATDHGPLEQRLAERVQQLGELEETARREVLLRRAADVPPGNAPAPNVPATLPPAPIAAWDFQKSLRDLVGGAHAQLHADARQDATGLTVDGKQAHATSAPLDRPLRAKTLAAVVRLANLQQRGGGVIGLQTLDGNLFDAIVYGEQESERWMAGSNNFARTRSFQGPAETRADKEPVHVAWTYAEDGTIAAFVGGLPYGMPYKTALQPFEAAKSQLVFGLRHAPVGGNRMLAGTILRAAVFDRALNADEVLAVARAAGSQVVSEAELAEQLGPAGRGRRQWLREQIAADRDTIHRTQAGRVYAITPQTAPITRRLARGNPAQPLEPVAAGGLRHVSGPAADFGLATDAAEADRRAKLAGWIATADNPLFARAIANRLWHYHFGAGLVATPNDLGFNGGLPSHPELLEWLADSLVSHQFSLKRLHREMVLSDAYRQSSRPRPDALPVDADNRLLWRMNLRRLEAEAVRDAMLAVADQLNRQQGGPGYHDFRPFLRGGTQFYEPLDPVGPAYQRRSIYRTWARGGHNRLLDTFDCPDPSTITPRRSVTTTPLQALALLNNSFVLRMADALADAALRDAALRDAAPTVATGAANAASPARSPAPDTANAPARVADNANPLPPAAIVRALFRRAYGRDPDAAERAVSEPFVARQGPAALARLLLNANSFVYVE